MRGEWSYHTWQERDHGTQCRICPSISSSSWPFTTPPTEGGFVIPLTEYMSHLYFRFNLKPTVSKAVQLGYIVKTTSSICWLNSALIHLSLVLWLTRPTSLPSPPFTGRFLLLGYQLLRTAWAGHVAMATVPILSSPGCLLVFLSWHPPHHTATHPAGVPWGCVRLWTS